MNRSTVPVRTLHLGSRLFVLTSLFATPVACDSDAGLAHETTELDAADFEATDTSTVDPPVESRECLRETYALSDSTSAHGCSYQIDALIAGVPTAGDTLAAAAPDPLSAANGRRLKECTWASYVDTANTMLVLCPDDRHVVSGGCYAQRRLLNSAPFESQTAANLPEADERVQDVTALSGWACTYDGPYQSAGQSAAALCCN